jgi:hypothetical protein
MYLTDAQHYLVKLIDARCILLHCLVRSQIVADSAAAGSDDTKGASRILFNTLQLIMHGLTRTIMMGVCYGTLIALHGNKLAQLTPLTQVIMGSIQV